MKNITLFVSVAILALVTSVVGCNKSTTDSATSSTTPPAQDTQTGHDPSDHDQDGAMAGQTDMDKMMVELAKLSPEDAASAKKQHFCPVSGKMLGAMGPPKKVDVNGQQVWICCDGCRKSLLNNPDQYLAKLNQN